MNHFQPAEPIEDPATALQEELELLLHEARVYEGTWKGELLDGKAALVAQQMESLRRRSRGEIWVRPDHKEAWRNFFNRLDQ